MQVWALSLLGNNLVFPPAIGVVIGLHIGVHQCRVKLGIAIKNGDS